MALFMDIGPNDTICVGGDTYITLEKKSGQRARLRIVGDTPIELLKEGRKVQRPLNLPATSTGD